MTEAQPAMASPIEVLAQNPSLQALDRPILEAMVAAADIYHVEAGATLFRAGEAFGNVVYLLYAGRMRQRWQGGEGSDVQLGDVLGLGSYFDRTTLNATAEAVTDCVLLGIAAESLGQLELDYPSLCNCLHHLMADKLRELIPTHEVNSGALAQPVRGIMTAPVAACPPDMPLRQALILMRERHIGSLVVTDHDHKLVGMLTQADLADAVLLQEAQPHDPIIDTACRPPQTVEPDTPLWKVQDIQQHQGAKYVVVVDQEVPLGVVSQTDILRTLMASPGTLAPHIAAANSLGELAAVRSRLAEEAAQIREANQWARTAVRFLSETHLAIQRRAIDLTLHEMQQQGHGHPPAPFAVIIMGSGGRKEMLLNPDQDNGLIIADVPASQHAAVQRWFAYFSQSLNANLDQIGYPLCLGHVMARNPVYRHTLSAWQTHIAALAERPTEEVARWSTTMFDFDTLYGDDTLTAALWRHVLPTVQAHPRWLQRMTADDARGRPALGFFHQLVATTRDASGAHIDLKRNGMRLIADATRIFALRAGISSPNTSDRLEALVRAGALPEAFSTSVSDAYEALLDHLLAHQIGQARAGLPIDTLLDPKTLTEQSRAKLRLAMRIVKRLQDRLQETFGATFYLE